MMQRSRRKSNNLSILETVGRKPSSLRLHVKEAHLKFARTAAQVWFDFASVRRSKSPARTPIEVWRDRNASPAVKRETEEDQVAG